MENFRRCLKIKLNEMETWTEEEEESATEASEREFVASDEHDQCMREMEDLKAEVASLKEKVKKEEQVLKCNLKRLEEEYADIISKIPSVLDEEEKLKDTRENVRLMTNRILCVNKQACSFFQEYDAIHEDLLQKLKGQLI
jgi:uncharacterized protein (DUF3084 family)